MKRIVKRGASAFVASAFVLAAGCSMSEEPTDAAVESPVIGGFDAKHPAYDAVGALVRIEDDGSTRSFCTATLIGPTAVVSAKHCFLFVRPETKVGFAIGFDSEAPKRVVPLSGWEWERGKVDGGVMDLGADVAIGYLSEAVTDVAALRIGHVTEADLGKKFLAVGYGGQASPFVDPTASASATSGETEQAERTIGTRKGAVRTLRAREGRYWETAFPTFEAFHEAWAAVSPDDANQPDFEVRLRAEWENRLLLPGYDLVFGGIPGEPDICGGDSGGPILRAEAGTWTIVGITSGYMSLPHVTPYYECHHEPTVYSAFGPQAQHLVDAALACGGVTQRGGCDGGEAVRCTRIHEGPARVVRNDCEAVQQICSPTPTEPVCAPACTTDVDCEALAPNGTCDTVSGQCRWAPSCADEGQATSCAFCCFGQTDDPMSCLPTCSLGLAPDRSGVVDAVAGRQRVRR